MQQQSRKKSKLCHNLITKDFLKARIYRLNVSEQNKIIYDLFDAKGRYLQSFSWKETGGEIIRTVDKNGDVFTIAGRDESPKIRKYRLSFQ